MDSFSSIALRHTGLVVLGSTIQASGYSSGVYTPTYTTPGGLVVKLWIKGIRNMTNADLTILGTPVLNASAITVKVPAYSTFAEVLWATLTSSGTDTLTANHLFYFVQQDPSYVTL